MDVKDIVRSWLETNGYDGLYSPGECACERDDLAPCTFYVEIPGDCKPGYKADCSDDCTHEGADGTGWHIQAERTA